MANKVAHIIAIEAPRINAFQAWVEESPLFIQDILAFDKYQSIFPFLLGKKSLTRQGSLQC